jgi:HNH endonuclease
MGNLLRLGNKCKVCGEFKPRDKLRLNKAGQIRESICTSCRLRKFLSRRIRWADRLVYKKAHCERCGFQGHPCQLDVDHIDGDHTNDTPENYQTLCANCHRLKSFEEKEGIFNPQLVRKPRPTRAKRTAERAQPSPSESV